ncbi:uncharacterized protein LOC131830112 [Mustela lutreola]|uniref:uncharacterized protein LOC131830112 n=1 Tax=Mustela lutreola TaxID=9666 RepID=UPI002796F911|nr:uncharacterized protein LOC131830112 [Mustela lutreola]
MDPDARSDPGTLRDPEAGGSPRTVECAQGPVHVGGGGFGRRPLRIPGVAVAPRSVFCSLPRCRRRGEEGSWNNKALRARKGLLRSLKREPLGLILLRRQLPLLASFWEWGACFLTWQTLRSDVLVKLLTSQHPAPTVPENLAFSLVSQSQPAPAHHWPAPQRSPVQLYALGSSSWHLRDATALVTRVFAHTGLSSLKVFPLGLPTLEAMLRCHLLSKARPARHRFPSRGRQAPALLQPFSAPVCHLSLSTLDYSYLCTRLISLPD